MTRLTAKQVNMLKAIIESGAAANLYNRLKWDTPKNLRLSQEELDIIFWHLEENDMLSFEDRQLLLSIVKGV